MRLAQAFVATLALLYAGCANSAPLDWRGQVKGYQEANTKQIVGEFSDLLAIPNFAGNLQDIERNADYLISALERRGFAARRLSAGPNTPPAVFGELDTPNATRTVVFYAHYDGQPAPEPDWRSPPWVPVVREGGDARTARDVDWRSATRIDPAWRIYARSASDDKASIQALLSALDALNAIGKKPTVKVKVFYEGEEEYGSAHLSRILAENKGVLSGDLLVFGDGPRHPSGRVQVVFGARGFTGLDLSVYGPRRPLHSGHYGNWVPNPAVMLTHLLAGMRDEDNRILIPGFYDDVVPLTAAEQALLADLPDIETGLRAELLLGRTEGADRLAAAISQPALNITGLRVGDVGDRATNVISTQAHASIDFRLARGQTPERVRDQTNRYLAARGWHVTEGEPSEAELVSHPKVVKVRWQLGYPAYRGRPDTSEAKAVIQAIRGALGEPVAVLPSWGSSIPMHTFDRALGMPIIAVSIANHDNNQHSANENIKIESLLEAIPAYAGMLTMTW